MRLVLFFLGGFFLANLVVAAVTAIRPLASEQHPREFNMSQKRQDPWAMNEPIQDQARKTARANALAALDGEWSGFCGEDGRARLVSGLGYYYEQRSIQERGYPAAYGDAGARHVRKVWSTPEDQRIEKLTRDIYSRGYFRPDDFRPHVKDAISEQISGQTVAGKACAG